MLGLCLLTAAAPASTAAAATVTHFSRFTHEREHLPSSAPGGRGVDGVDAMACFGDLMMMMNVNRISCVYRGSAAPTSAVGPRALYKLLSMIPASLFTRGMHTTATVTTTLCQRLTRSAVVAASHEHTLC
jgi:hypothetical protein